MIPVDPTSEVNTVLRAMVDDGSAPQRCHKSAISSAIAGSYRYELTDGSRSILAEQIKNEIYDGATPIRPMFGE